MPMKLAITVGVAGCLRRGELPTICKTNKLPKTYSATVHVHWCPEARALSQSPGQFTRMSLLLIGTAKSPL